MWSDSDSGTEIETMLHYLPGTVVDIPDTHAFIIIYSMYVLIWDIKHGKLGVLPLGNCTK